MGNTQSYAGLGKIVAVRVQDLTRHIWYSWSDGYWLNAGGGDSNAPIGESPRCVSGGTFYIAAYTQNISEQTGLVGCRIILDGVTVIARTNTVAPGSGVDVEKTDRLMPATGNVHVKVDGEGLEVPQIVEFDIVGISNGGDGNGAPYDITIEQTVGGTTVPAAGRHTGTGYLYITAYPSPGYKFDHWDLNGNPLSTEAAIGVDLGPWTLTPNFVIGAGGDNTLLIVGGIGAALIIVGVAAFALKRKKP